MRYSGIFDDAAAVVARRMFQGVRSSGGAELPAPRANPLFRPCLIAFTLLGMCFLTPLNSFLCNLTTTWLPSPLVGWSLLLVIVYPLARFCTTLLALRARRLRPAVDRPE
jgi:hypothetical protein